jgi:hypothetical protein
MAITFPLTVPSHTGFRSLEIKARTIVGSTASIFTGQQQVYAWQGQWNEFTVELPSMSEANAAIWAAFFLSLNGPEGTFYMGPSVRKVTGGTKAGTVTVDTGAVANATTLPITGGTGDFAVGDWLQVGLTTAAKLHRVMQVNVGSVDVFPRLRSAYVATTAITYANPVGIFRLSAIPSESYDPAKLANGFSFNAIESL